MKTDPEAPAAALPGAGEATARGGALRSGGFVISALLSLLTVPLMVRHLGVVGFGRWVSVLALVNIVGLAAELGLNAVALREYPLRSPAERDRLLGAAFGLRLALVVAGTVVALGFALVSEWTSAMVAGTLIASVALFVGAWQDLQSVRLSGELRFVPVTQMEVARAVVTALVVVVLVLAGAGLVPFFGVYIAGSAVAVFLGARALRGRGRIAPRFRRAEWRAFWADAAVYAVASAVYVVYFRVVVLVASVQATALQAGYFATGFRVTEFLVAIPGVLAASVLPVLSHAAQHDRARLERATAGVLRLGLVAGVGVALVLALAAPTVMRILGGERAVPGAPVLRIQAVAVATSFVAFGTGATLLALRRHRALLVVNLLALVVATVAAVLLIDSHGARGAAWATVGGECVVVVGQAIALRGTLRVRGVAGTALAVAAGAALAIGVFVVLPIPVVPATAVAVALYSAVVIATGQVPPQLRSLVSAAPQRSA